jgi:hypothetical protein
MHINRKWPISRAEHIDDDGVSWIAEARSGTGVWVIRDAPNDHPVFGDMAIVGAMFEFTDRSGSLLLSMTPLEREELGMTDEVYQALNAELRRDKDRMKP